MRKLLKASLNSISPKLGGDPTKQTIQQFLKLNNITSYDQMTVRLPDNEVKILLKMPCPVTKHNLEDTSIFKKLRAFYKIQQITACSKCQLNCQFRQIKADRRTYTPVQDIIYLLYSLSIQSEDHYSVLRWSAAYKVCQSLKILLRYPIENNIQALLFQQFQKGQEAKNRKKSKFNVKKHFDNVRKEKIEGQLKDRRIKL